MENLYDDYQDSINNDAPKIDAHLNSPIRGDIFALFKEAVRLYPKREYDGNNDCFISYVKIPNAIYVPVKTLLSMAHKLEETKELFDYNPSLVSGTMLSEFLHQSVKSGKYDGFDNIQLSITTALAEIILTYDHRLKGEFSTMDLSLTDEEKRMYYIKCELEDIRNEMMKLSETRQSTWKILPLPYNLYPYIIINRGFALIVKVHEQLILKGHEVTTSLITRLVEAKAKLTFISYEMFLMILDTSIARFYTLYPARLISDRFQFKIPVSKIIELYSIFDDGLKQKGNSIYDEIKMFEAITHGLIISKSDTLELKDDFLKYLISEAKANNYTSLINIYNILKELDVEQLIEIHGIHRHWGHPIVDELAGCEKVYKISESRRPVDEQTCTNIAGCLIRQLCIEFIAKHNRWPKCNIDKLGNDHPLAKLINDNERRFNLYELKIGLEDWAQIEIQNELEFDPIVDYTSIMSDRSIAPILRENQYTYNQDITGNNTKDKLSTSRRLLVEILNRKSVDVDNICEMIQSRNIPAPWKIVKLSPKERELNITPRLFAMFPLEIRLYFAALESNIAKKVFPYFPQQSMTLNEEKLSKRLITISTPREHTTTVEIYVEVFVGIDFKSWNLHWSIPNTHPFSKLLDSWFGRDGLYSYGHQFFGTSEVSLSSNFLVPEKFMAQDKPHQVLNNRYLWYMHNGGFEGIMQKMWTFITIGLLLYIEEKTGIKASIIGQGDNQICKLTIPVPDRSSKSREEILRDNEAWISQQVSRFMTELDNITKLLGLELKRSESWVSDSTMIYSKEFYIRGANQSQYFKRSGRTMADVNDNYPTSPIKIGTIQAAGYAAASKTVLSAIPWAISNFETTMCLFRDYHTLSQKYNEFTRKHKNVDKAVYNINFIRFFLLTSGEYTGYPLLSLLDYEFRGHPDPFSTYITFLMKLSKGSSKTAEASKKLLSLIWNEKLAYGDASAELLVCNPSAINYKVPPPISQAFKKEVFHYLESNIQNQQIKELFSVTNQEFDKALFKYMIECTPVVPRLFNVITSHTPTGTRLYMVSKFTNTKTIMKISLGETTLGTSNKITETDSEFFAHLFRIYKLYILHSGEYPQCPTKIVDKVRNNSYASILQGRSIIGVTIPHPAHILDIKYDDIETEGHYISVLAKDGFTFDKIFSLGKQPVFVGTTTHEKVSGRVVTVNRASRPFQDAVRLKQMQAWAVDKDSTLYQFIEDLIKVRTNVPSDLIAQIGGTNYIGSHIHRVNDPVTKHNVKNQMRHSITTHFAFSSDKLGITARGGDDYNIHISELILYSMRDIVKSCIFDPEYCFKYLRGRQVNDCCLHAYDNMQIQSSAIPPTIPPIGTNPLIYSTLEEFYEIVVPDSVLVESSKSVEASKAIGYYLVSKYRGIHSDLMIVNQELVGPNLSKISVSEVINNGIMPIIQGFAFYLYLYMQGDYRTMRHALSGMGSKIWAGIAEICLMKDILPTLLKELAIDGIPGAYESVAPIVKRLNELLVQELDKLAFHSAPYQLRSIYKRVPFFLIKNMKFQSIILMWNYRNLIINLYDEAVYREIKMEIFNNVKRNIPWNLIMGQIVGILFKIDNGMTLVNMESSHRIIIMKNSPEYYFRLDTSMRTFEQVSSDQGYHNVDNHTVRGIIDGGYPIVPYIIDDILDINTMEYQDLTIMSNTSIETPNTRKSRLEQAFRIIGTLSTGFYKIGSIAYIERMILGDSVVCVADGEASVSYALAHMSKKPVYYNSLGPTTVTPQRYEDFCPGSFSSHRSLIKGEMLSLIYGGDLTDRDYLSRFITILPQDISLLTCDAETSGHFAFSLKQQIILSLLIILQEKNVQNCIFKEFLDNLVLLSCFLSSLRMFFSSVKVVIPMYSSHENGECFIVCTRPKLKDTKIYNMDSQSLYAERNYLRHVHGLKQLLQRKCREKVPFLYKQDILRMHYINYGLQLGLSYNYTVSLKKLTRNGIEKCKSYLELTNALQQLIVTSQDLINTTAIMHGYMNTLDIKKPIMKKNLQVGEHKSLIRAIGNITDVLIACDLLLCILPIEDLMEANAAYMSNIYKSRQISLTPGSVFYDYTVTDIQSWETMYLKHMWRVWGYIHKP